MAITYAVGVITVNGGITYDLDDVYNADVAGAWGVWSKQGEQHYCNAKLLISGANTKLIDSNVALQIGSATARKWFQCDAGTEFKFNGCMVTFYLDTRKTSYGYLEFVNCVVIEDETTLIALYLRGNQKIQNTALKVETWYCRDGSVEMDNIILETVKMYYYDVTSTNNDVTITGDFRVTSFPVTMKNTVFSGEIDINTADTYIVMVNSSWGSLAFGFASDYLLEQWEFNILVVDKDNVNIEGATVLLYDKNGDLKHAGVTGADGKLAACWNVTNNRYDGIAETKTEYGPFALTVSKEGYTTYETKIACDHIIENDQVVLDALDYTLDDIKAETKKIWNKVRRGKGTVDASL